MHINDTNKNIYKFNDIFYLEVSDNRIYMKITIVTCHHYILCKIKLNIPFVHFLLFRNIRIFQRNIYIYILNKRLNCSLIYANYNWQLLFIVLSSINA